MTDRLEPPPQPERPMHEAEFRLGLACNQHCVHCHLHSTRREPADLTPIEPRLLALVARGVKRVTLGGGEPTLSRQLLPALRELQARGVDAALETNGQMLATATARQRLRELGVHRVTVHLPGITYQSYGAVTRDPDGFATVLTALDGLLADGFEVGVAMPVLAINLADVAAIGGFLGQRLPGVRRCTLHTYHAQPPMAPIVLHPSAQAWQTAMQAALTGLEAAGVQVVLPHGAGLPACLLTAPERSARLVARCETPTTLPQACKGCVVHHECPGPPAGLLQAHPELQLQPVLRRAVSRQLAAIHTRSQPEENWIRRIVEPDPAGQPVLRELLLRVVQQCNERCSFCWVDFDAQPCPEPLIWQALQEVAQTRPAPIVSFTGGEPTLHPQLAAFVAAAREAGAISVQLQTNATRVDAAMATRLQAAGLTHALVGLHAHEPALYGQVTGTPQLFEAAVTGVRALLEAGVAVMVNHVLSRENARTVVDFVRFAGNRLTGATGQRPILLFAVAADIAGGPLRREVLPSLTELAGPLRQALDVCLAEGIAFGGLTHPCGMPPCLLGGDPRYFHDALRWRFDGDEPIDHATFSDAVPGKTPACADCVYDRFCPGLRAEYVAVHGTAELQPIRAWPGGRSPAMFQQSRRFAVLGLGRMGQRQVRILAAAHPGAGVLACSRREVDPTQESMVAQCPDAALHPRPTLPDLHGAALVSLCQETAAHLTVGLAVITALGALPQPRPMLLIEKPLAATANDAQQLVDAATAHDVRLFVHHTQIAEPGVAALRQVCASHRLGAVLRLHLERSEQQTLVATDVVAALPVLHDHLVHEWSLVDALIGGAAPESVSARVTLFPGGFIADLAASVGTVAVTIRARISADGRFGRTLAVTGSTGSATLLQAPGQRELQVDGIAMELPTGDGLEAALRHVAHLALAGQDPQPWLTAGLSGQAGARVLAAVERLLAALPTAT